MHTFIGLILSVQSKPDFDYTLAVASLELQNNMAALQAFPGTMTFDGFVLPWRFLEDISVKRIDLYLT